MALGVLIATLCLPGPRSDAAEIKSGNTVTIAETIEGIDSAAPGVAARSSRSEMLVTWSASAGVAGSPATAVFGQRLGGKGQRLAEQLRISSGFGAYPAVSFNSVDDEYFVVYRGEPRESGEYEILGRRISGEGQLLEEFPIFADGGLGPPAVAFDSANERFLVAAVGNRGLQGRVMAANGTPWGPPRMLQPAAMGLPALIYDSTGKRYFLAFETPSDTESDILGLAVDAEGNLPGTTFPVAGGQGRQAYPALAPADNGFISTWTDFGKGKPRVFLGRLDDGGGPIGRVRLLARPAEASRLAAFPDDRLLAVWARPQGPVSGQLLSKNLDTGSPAFRLSGRGPALAAAAAYLQGPAEALAVWAARNSSGSAGIYGQRIKKIPLATAISVDLEIGRKSKGKITGTDGSVTEIYTPTYTITIANQDTVTAESLRLTLDVSGGFMPKPAYPECRDASSVVVCKLGDLAAGKTLRLFFKDRADASCKKGNANGKIVVRGTATVRWENHSDSGFPVQWEDRKTVCSG